MSSSACVVDGMEYSSVASQNTMHGKLLTTTFWFNENNLYAQNAQLSWLLWSNKSTFGNPHAKAGEQNLFSTLVQ